MDTQNYKRTLAGSVGAGMGALMGASGRRLHQSIIRQANLKKSLSIK